MHTLNVLYISDTFPRICLQHYLRRFSGITLDFHTCEYYFLHVPGVSKKEYKVNQT